MGRVEPLFYFDCWDGCWVCWNQTFQITSSIQRVLTKKPLARAQCLPWDKKSAYFLLYCFIQLHFSSMHGGLKCDTTLKRTTLFYITIGKLCFLLYCCFALLCPQSNSHFMFCPHGINSRALLRQVVDWKNRKILHQSFHHCKYFCFACFVLFKNL